MAQNDYDPKAHVVVGTLGAFLNKIKSRGSRVDISGLKVFVLDEADSFFLVDDRKKELKDFD